VGLLAPIRHYVETLIHPSAQHDVLTAARHRAFIAPRLLGSIVALAAFPIYLLLRGVPSAIELVIVAWLVVPVLTAYFLSRTGRYESAHVLSSLALTGMVTAVAVLTGGIASFAAIWLVVVPLEAALSASRRVVATASTFALGAAGLLLLLSAHHVLRLPLSSMATPTALAALGIVSAGLYATGLALGSEALARTSFWLLYAEEDRYRLLARNITDVITRHGRDGVVLFVSPAGEELFGARSAELHGHGLFDRVHVADRPAYLTALGDAAALGESSSVEFRVRRQIVGDDGLAVPDFVWIEMRCRPFQQNADAGEPDRREVVAVLRDVTERKRQQQALADAYAVTERADAAKSRFLATMSHELRTPLNAIIGFSDMLMSEASLMLDLKRRNEYAGLINSSGHHLLAVVNGILDMSKIETGNFEITPESFAPGQVVTGCCELLALRAGEAGVRLERVSSASLPQP
jgi:cell cycle sensor histidine kinase DivJ